MEMSRTSNQRGVKLKNYGDANNVNVIGPEEDTHMDVKFNINL